MVYDNTKKITGQERAKMGSKLQQQKEYFNFMANAVFILDNGEETVTFLVMGA